LPALHTEFIGVGATVLIIGVGATVLIIGVGATVLIKERSAGLQACPRNGPEGPHYGSDGLSRLIDSWLPRVVGFSRTGSVRLQPDW
jgi:hypothetical protein